MMLRSMRSKDARKPVGARARRRRGLAAYTAVEVLMSLAVLAVGVVGIIATEKVTLAANAHAKNLAIATRIGQSWLGMLEAEAALWSSDGSLARTVWLQQGNGIATWFRPTYDNEIAFGPAFDALGNPVRTQDQANNARFCVDLRLAPLTPNSNGGGLLRTEVRVVWLRDDNSVSGSGLEVKHACDVAAVSVADEAESRLFHFLFLSGGVRQVGG